MTYLDQLYYQLPLLAVVVGGCVLLLLEAFAGAGNRRWVMHLGVGVCLVALAATWLVWRRVDHSGAVALFDGMILADKFSLFLTMVFLLATVFAMLISADYFSEHAHLYGELYALLLFATA